MWDRMVAGALYRPGDPDLAQQRRRAQDLMRRYNATILGDPERGALLDQLLGDHGPGCAIRTPFSVDYGRNIRLGADVFFNYGCVVLDVCPVTVGDRTQIGPLVQILTADHPRDPALRDGGWELGRPVAIGRNVWIGGGAILLPGITVGDDAVIGAGAVVTRDVAAGSTVAGSPARPLSARDNN
jgi:maltose O-acetyltransferase